ncbi:hypothetical protein CCHR01_06539 [Colletotrichum chrysophilum]|uniref:C2H2-type domain-containing protein n=1 Tax=Colletotrichum chrysophilum TaxID=1836956 RepID=A0AAD9APJ4_9PEZI|nr:hypothetical protein CCHR01_06539 [Colletotrichum chrysophilum]
MFDHFDNSVRAARSGGDHWDYSTTGGPIMENSTCYYVKGESRSIIHLPETETSASNPLSQRFLNQIITDGGAAAHRHDNNGNSLDAELQAMVSSTPTGDQYNSRKRFLSHDSQASQHGSPVRKSDDVPFIAPGILQKRHHLRTKRKEAVVRKETRREHSVESVSDGGSLEVDDDLRQPSLRDRRFHKENSPGDTTLSLFITPFIFRNQAIQIWSREHLYRRHQQQPYCFRCGRTFLHPKDVEAHLSRPEGICDLVRGVSVEGLTAEQIQKLKSKKRKPGVTTDEEKWHEIFKIVFPDATNRPDPYYCQTDVDSICRRILSELEERIPTMLEPLFGPLEGHKRQKVLDTFESFFAERMYQSRQGEALPKNDQDIPCEIVTPESVGHNPGAQRSLARKLRKDGDIPVLLTASITTNTVKPWQSSALQEELECRIFSPPNEITFGNIPTENEDVIGIDTGKGVRPNEGTSAAGPSSGRRVGFANGTHGFVSLHDSNSLLKADGASVEFDFDDFLKDWEGQSPSGPASGATSHFHT